MATLAIEGHKTRHNEIIQIFEMLGGVNKYFTACTRSNYFYFIDIYKGIQVIKEDQIDYALFDVYTLEDFLEKYPYKVGDYARLSRSNIAVIIKAMKWENNEVVYQLSCSDGWWSVDNLKPYKEETMEERENSVVVNIEHKQLKVHSLRFDKTKLVINDEYELKQEGDTYYIVRKQPQ